MSKLNLIAITVVFVLTATLTQAQTSSFTYQGRFTDGGSPANGTYEMQFRLFDASSAGNQVGSTITNSAVNVSNGVFTVQLDYGASAFSGADRYLEIGLRPAGDSSAYTFLAPRQQLTSSVYAIRAGSATSADNAANATNASQLGGVAASQYVQANDSRLTDARTPIAGSSNYIQNGGNQQTADFNISGNGTAGGALSANSVNANSQYNIGGNRVLSIAGNHNTFAGVDSGKANTNGTENSFFGWGSGAKNISGKSNSIFGYLAGSTYETGDHNAYFGIASGGDSGSDNSFFGSFSGANNKGSMNSYFGSDAGSLTFSGTGNVFLGNQAGQSANNNTEMTLVGSGTGLNTHDLSNATAIGARSSVTQSNSLVLGSIKDVNFATQDTNVGIGTTAPKSRLHIQVNGNSIHLGHAGCASGFVGLGFGSSLSGCTNYSLLGDGTNTYINRRTGGTLFFRENNNLTQMSIAPGGVVAINNLGSGGITPLCYNGANQISNCSSSLRYKKDLQPFNRGLALLNQLKPITFKWKANDMDDLGFGAEDIAAVEPLLVTRNSKGEVEGVKYDRITAVLVNAVKEQQEQIKELKKLVCRRNRRAAVCK